MKRWLAHVLIALAFLAGMGAGFGVGWMPHARYRYETITSDRLGVLVRFDRWTGKVHCAVLPGAVWREVVKADEQIPQLALAHWPEAFKDD